MSTVRLPTQASEFYAFDREVDSDGQPVLVGSQWAAESPTAVAVSNILATPLGSMLSEPTFGLDLSAIAAATPGAEPRIVAAVEKALAPLTGAGIIERLNVTARIVARGSVVLDLSFYDPRLRDRVSVEWRS